MQADSVVSGTNGFINLWLRFFDTRREIQFLKSLLTILCWTYYADHPNARCILWCLRSQFISTGRDPKNGKKNSTLCLHGIISILNWLFSKSSNFQDHLFRAWRHPHPSPFPVWGFIMTMAIVISFAREHKLHQLTIHLGY